MNAPTLLKYAARVPRYTSYPTAAQFHAGIGAACYSAWLERLDPAQAVSIYCHVPFCHSLCWFCGCNMQVVRRAGVLDWYAELLCREIDLVADLTPGHLRVSHLHWGGGTPTMLGLDRLRRVLDRLGARFDLSGEVAFAIEIDPRTLTRDAARELAALGLSRASIGVQDFDPAVQRAINRVQSFTETAAAVDALRASGVDDINIDLIYGLPLQTEAGFLATVECVHRLAPDRIALFGYAHVPWMKRHQRLIDAEALPGPAGRLRLYTAAARRLEALGYRAIGLDHFARPESALARAAAGGRLRRNFQGYTSDDAAALLGLGASGISSLPGGIAQNATAPLDYRRAIDAGRLATARGVARTADDRLRAEIIERLMCDLRVDLAAVCARHGSDPAALAPELARLDRFVDDGLAVTDGTCVTVTRSGRPLVRAIGAVFDRYLNTGRMAHAPAI